MGSPHNEAAFTLDVPAKEFRNKLSYFLMLAENGTRIRITQHKKPVVVLSSAVQTDVPDNSIHPKLLPLVKAGLLIPGKRQAFVDFEPIAILGEPMSQTVIDMRN
jgi:prevent-host-death family protein